MYFEILGDMESIEVIASGRGVRQRALLRAAYGGDRWRKMKGEAQVVLDDGSVRRAEIHWFEAHGVGRRRFKIKRILE